MTIILHDFCPRCQADWDVCKCLWMTAEERHEADEARFSRETLAVAEEVAARQRWIRFHGLEGVLK